MTDAGLIRIRGARTHNLRNLSVDIPRNRLVVFTGVSGSGKSSLAFDTIYAEGQRRYVESLSAYARQFLELMPRPALDGIEGLSPAIAIEQKAAAHNPRSTVGTVTEIHDYLRLLYARIGTPHCPEHGLALAAQTVTQMVEQTLSLPADCRLMLLAPVVRARKGTQQGLLEALLGEGFSKVRIDGQVYELEQAPALIAGQKHQIEVVIDRFRPRAELRQRLAESFETTLRLADGLARVVSTDGPPVDILYSAQHACPYCGFSVAELEPRLFSFNSPAGACPQCDGLGLERYGVPERLVPHPQRTLAEGAVQEWGVGAALQTLVTLVRQLGADPGLPFAQLPSAVQQALLYGNPAPAFPGVIPMLQQEYRQLAPGRRREALSHYFAERSCQACGGARLNQTARHVQIAGVDLVTLCQWPLDQVLAWVQGLQLPPQQQTIASRILEELRGRLGFLLGVGLNYLNLARSAETLSGGEAQRIRLASQIGAGLVGVTYVLDEPSIGLHQRDNARLLQTLWRLRDLGNSVLVVEHDEETIRAADYVLDLGPGAGVHGGQIVAQGTPAQIAARPESLTGQYLSGQRQISLPTRRVLPQPGRQLLIQDACGHNLQHLTVAIPLGLFTCVTGVSGSGKSTLINDTLLRHVWRHFYKAGVPPAPVADIRGLEYLDKVVEIDQSPIGRTPRSNPATYTGVFEPLRELLASTPEARMRGYGPGRFSFNVKGGRCEVCEGDGVLRVPMHFLPDVYVRCDACQGQRYNQETLEVRYRGLSIAEILQLTVDAALDLFGAIPAVAQKLRTLQAVGLGYVQLGQSATTLSGGEAQRVKLARELARRDTGKTLYILDEPTTGLHVHDVAQLLNVLHRLRDQGNTVVVIEHNLDVIKTADWLVDLGPEGGTGGGQLLGCGTPEALAQCPQSHTGRYLAPLLMPR